MRSFPYSPFFSLSFSFPFLSFPSCPPWQRPFESDSDEEPEAAASDFTMTAQLPDYDFMRNNRIALSQVRVAQDGHIVFSRKEADAVKRYSF